MKAHSSALTIGSSTTVTGTEIPAGYTLWNITAITGDSGAFNIVQRRYNVFRTGNKYYKSSIPLLYGEAVETQNYSAYLDGEVTVYKVKAHNHLVEGMGC